MRQRRLQLHFAGADSLPRRPAKRAEEISADGAVGDLHGPRALRQAGKLVLRLGHLAEAIEKRLRLDPANSALGEVLALEGQNLTDPHYLGAVAAIYVQGIGITCDPPPVGFAFDGVTFVNGMGEANFPNSIYPYYAKH